MPGILQDLPQPEGLVSELGLSQTECCAGQALFWFIRTWHLFGCVITGCRQQPGGGGGRGCCLGLGLEIGTRQQQQQQQQNSTSTC
jgi:hypothetical protein